MYDAPPFCAKKHYRGSGHALWINDEFEGRSTECETFDNPPLEPNSEFFQCVGVEVYGFN